jgi:hypothetical protein
VNTAENVTAKRKPAQKRDAGQCIGLPFLHPTHCKTLCYIQLRPSLPVPSSATMLVLACSSTKERMVVFIYHIYHMRWPIQLSPACNSDPGPAGSPTICSALISYASDRHGPNVLKLVSSCLFVFILSPDGACPIFVSLAPIPPYESKAGPLRLVFLSRLGLVAKLLLAFHSGGRWNLKLGFSTSGGNFQYFCWYLST